MTVKREDAIPATALLETASDVLSALSSGPSRTTSTVTVWVPQEDAAKTGERIRAMLRAAQAKRIVGATQMDESLVLDEEWESSWKNFYQPFAIAPDLFIAPSWERAFRAPRNAVTLWLDPGMAFGTGQHPTTALALALLLPEVRPGAVVLDIGCGSGILAAAAAQRGARVYASDPDALAVNVTKANLKHNKLSARAVVRARDVPVSFPRADVIVANITARVLVRLAPVLADKLKRKGTLITSGIVARGKGPLLRAFTRAGLQCMQRCSAAEWFGFAHTRRTSR